MSELNIIISGVVKQGEAALYRAQNPGFKVCDAVNFHTFNFKGAKIKAVGDDKLTKYLVAKAVKAGASKA